MTTKQPNPPSLEDLRACAWRELAMRRKFYPKWISAGKISAADADREIALMRAIYEHLGGTDRDRDAAARDLFG
ncbi:MAG: hypothetical protein MRY63_02560 [Neomegalonema sp.]|nr:hypothetical protein [Neomegalonema sp.]